MKQSDTALRIVQGIEKCIGKELETYDEDENEISLILPSNYTNSELHITHNADDFWETEYIRYLTYDKNKWQNMEHIINETLRLADTLDSVKKYSGPIDVGCNDLAYGIKVSIRYDLAQLEKVWEFATKFLKQVMDKQE